MSTTQTPFSEWWDEVCLWHELFICIVFQVLAFEFDVGRLVLAYFKWIFPFTATSFLIFALFGYLVFRYPKHTVNLIYYTALGLGILFIGFPIVFLGLIFSLGWITLLLTGSAIMLDYTIYFYKHSKNRFIF